VREISEEIEVESMGVLEIKTKVNRVIPDESAQISIDKRLKCSIIDGIKRHYIKSENCRNILQSVNDAKHVIIII
jgi:hypothetical protein